MLRVLLLLLCFFYALGGRAQTDSARPLIIRVPDPVYHNPGYTVPTGTIDIQAQDYAKTNHYVRINYDNDFFNATDRYYTQGIRLELIAPFMRYSPFSYALVRLGRQAQNYYGLALEQDCFTPSSIRHNEVFYGERPYAAVGLVSHQLISISSYKKQRLNTQLDLGAIGPCAMCEEEQKGIHHALVNIQPLGWQFQVSNDLVVNYDLQFEQGIISTRYLELIGYGGVRAGTLYDDASAGALLRVGWMPSYFEHLGIVKNATSHRFQFYFTGRAQAKLVGYNATMQGGLFNRSSIYTIPDSQVARYVLMGSAGAVLAYKRLSLEYTRVYITPEMTTGLFHGWGHVNITVCF